MKQEDKELLLIDLCARLPYGVICSIYRIDDWGVGWRDEKLTGYFYDGIAYEFYFGESPISIDNDISKIKPYLRPMSSMTEEEEKEYNEIVGYKGEDDDGWTICDNIHTKWGIRIFGITKLVDWLNAHHFDYCGLIEKGLAIAITKENNPYEKR